MSQQKMGTHYVREVAAMFRDAASACPFAAVKERLVSLADEIEPLAPKLYFKTQKGTTDMEQIVADMGDLKTKLAGCANEAEALALCDPLFARLEKIVHHVKTMKVRMT